jgi:signal transduction histidine kinase
LVQEETKRLSGLVETVLNISALEAGRLDLACQPLDIVEAVSTARDRFPARTGIERLQVNLPDNLPQISADPQALDSVLFHLIDNALKYDPEGNVYLKANGEETHLRISVTDQGPGIPLEERERIFDMFHRLDTSDARDTYGYGLGLPMVKRLLEAMGGTIQVRESEGGGSCFSFWLPYAE